MRPVSGTHMSGQELERLLTYELAKLLRAASGFRRRRSGAPGRIRKDEKTGEPKFLVAGTSEASTSASPCSSQFLD